MSDSEDGARDATSERHSLRASAPGALERGRASKRSSSSNSDGTGAGSTVHLQRTSENARPLMELLLEAPRHERGGSTYAHRSTHEVHASAYAIEAVTREHARAHVHTLARSAVSRQWSALVRTLLCAPVELVLERTSDGLTRTYPFGRAVSLLVRDRAHGVSGHAAIICLSSFAHFCCDLAASTASLLVFTPAVNAHLEARLDRVALLTRVLAHVLARVSVELHARARLMLETALLNSLDALKVRGRAADMERVRSLVADVRAHARDDVRAYRAPSAQERAQLDDSLSASPEPPSHAAARWPVAASRSARHSLSPEAHAPLERSASVPLPASAERQERRTHSPLATHSASYASFTSLTPSSAPSSFSSSLASSSSSLSPPLASASPLASSPPPMLAQSAPPM